MTIQSLFVVFHTVDTVGGCFLRPDLISTLDIILGTSSPVTIVDVRCSHPDLASTSDTVLMIFIAVAKIEDCWLHSESARTLVWFWRGFGPILMSHSLRLACPLGNYSFQNINSMFSPTRKRRDNFQYCHKREQSRL